MIGSVQRGGVVGGDDDENHPVREEKSNGGEGRKGEEERGNLRRDFGVGEIFVDSMIEYMGGNCSGDWDREMRCRWRWRRLREPKAEIIVTEIGKGGDGEKGNSRVTMKVMVRKKSTEEDGENNV